MEGQISKSVEYQETVVQKLVTICKFHFPFGLSVNCLLDSLTCPLHNFTLLSIEDSAVAANCLAGEKREGEMPHIFSFG